MSRSLVSFASIPSLALLYLLSAPANSAPVEYDIAGTFSDGGTFSGTFGYDPVADSYAVPNSLGSSTGDFNITTTSATQDPLRSYLPGMETTTGYRDYGTSTGFGVDGCCHMGITNFSFTWNVPLNTPAGTAAQMITGGSEIFQPFTQFPAITRDVTSGTINLAPVPLPASAWLLLSGIGALGAARRRRAR